LVHIKRPTTDWFRERSKFNQKYLKEVKITLRYLFEKNSSGVLLDEEVVRLRDYERKKKHLLELEELNGDSKAEGDNNTIFSHKFVAHRNNFNTIFEMESLDGNRDTSFSDLSLASK
jgi:hypothetical protein